MTFIHARYMHAAINEIAAIVARLKFIFRDKKKKKEKHLSNASLKIDIDFKRAAICLVEFSSAAMMACARWISVERGSASSFKRKAN